jgi:phage-related protein
MEIVYLAGVRDELLQLPPAERVAMANALDKLASLGALLPYPHSSQVKNTQLRELRPRQGRSPWRALYQRVGNDIVVAAISPEAQSNPRGFQRAIGVANERLTRYREARS